MNQLRFMEETDKDIKKMTREKENKELAKQEAEQVKDSAEQELA